MITLQTSSHEEFPFNSWGNLVNPSDHPPQDDFEKVIVQELLVEPCAAKPFVPCYDMAKYHSLQKSLRIIGLVSKFLQYFKRVTLRCDLRPLSILVNLGQKEHYPTLYRYLKGENPPHVSKDIVNFCNQIGLYLDEHDLIRCHGRVENSALSLSAKNIVKTQ